MVACSGADIALAQSLAADLGLEAVFVPTSWPTLMPDLAADRFDVALSGISITSERAAAASFSLPYHTGGKTILARCADRARFDTPQELDEARVRVIVNPGGTNEAWVRANLGQAQIRVHPDNRSIFQEIVAGRADAMVTDDVEAELQARRHPQAVPHAAGHADASREGRADAARRRAEGRGRRLAAAATAGRRARNPAPRGLGALIA